MTYSFLGCNSRKFGLFLDDENNETETTYIVGVGVVTLSVVTCNAGIPQEWQIKSRWCCLLHSSLLVTRQSSWRWAKSLGLCIHKKDHNEDNIQLRSYWEKDSSHYCLQFSLHSVYIFLELLNSSLTDLLVFTLAPPLKIVTRQQHVNWIGSLAPAGIIFVVCLASQIKLKHFEELQSPARLSLS